MSAGRFNRNNMPAGRTPPPRRAIAATRRPRRSNARTHGRGRHKLATRLLWRRQPWLCASLHARDGSGDHSADVSGCSSHCHCCAARVVMAAAKRDFDSSKWDNLDTDSSDDGEFDPEKIAAAALRRSGSLSGDGELRNADQRLPAYPHAAMAAKRDKDMRDAVAQYGIDDEIIGEMMAQFDGDPVQTAAYMHDFFGMGDTAASKGSGRGGSRRSWLAEEQRICRDDHRRAAAAGGGVRGGRALRRGSGGVRGVRAGILPAGQLLGWVGGAARLDAGGGPHLLKLQPGRPDRPLRHGGPGTGCVLARRGVPLGGDLPLRRRV